MVLRAKRGGPGLSFTIIYIKRRKNAEWTVQCHQTSGHCKYEAKRNTEKENREYIMNAYHDVTHFNLKFIHAVLNYTNTVAPHVRHAF